jgi:hypothetical protein
MSVRENRHAHLVHLNKLIHEVCMYVRQRQYLSTVSPLLQLVKMRMKEKV